MSTKLKTHKPPSPSPRPSSSKPSNPKQKQYSFYLPEELFAGISAFVNRHRNAPESMTINGFARAALTSELERATKKESSEKRARR